MLMNPTSAAKEGKGKRGRGAFKKIPVFGIFKRGGKVYIEIDPDCAKATLQAITRGRVDPDSVIHSDGWRGNKKNYRVNHGADQVVYRKCQINGIESFWEFAKGRLTKFHGIAGSTFYLHLKECEF